MAAAWFCLLGKLSSYRIVRIESSELVLQPLIVIRDLREGFCQTLVWDILLSGDS
jgi:hypothetical protein